jgi:mannose-1-phosphate guanylyltransferase/mannose-6-phosphate isomerase
VAVTGESVDDTPWLYDQAFVLLALAAAARAMPDRTDLIARAARLKAALGHFRWPAGGFREAGADTFQSNCHMHLFEAAMAMAVAAPDDGWRDLAGEIAGFALSRFVDRETGRLIEFFDEAWRPRRTGGSAIVDPGHQFEWAWLLRQWAQMSPNAHVEPVIQRLLVSGRDGINQRGVLINQIGEDGRVIDGKARLWPQTERLRSAYLTPRNEPERRAAHAGLQRYLAMPIAGLWCDQLDEQGQILAGPAPGSSLYHILGAVYAPQSAAALAGG